MKFRITACIPLLMLSCTKPQPKQFEKIQSSDVKNTGKIQWQPWSDSIFATAKKENRFVIMDLEAVWCHWCHVMEEKTYSNPDIIALIQSKYLPVRVDQDARPDLSSRYGDYGWPATIVFNGDGKEITKQQGFIESDVMKKLLELIVKNPNDPSLLDQDDSKLSESKSDFLNIDQKLALETKQRSYYDARQGGWGFSHKFLDENSLDYALANASKDKDSKDMAIQTLSHLISIIDPVWGGMYQYSTDGDWKHPHFEKIMSIQTQAINVYAHGYAIFKDSAYKNAAEKIYNYVKLFLMSPDGVFYTSQDADLIQGEHAGGYFELNDRQRRKKGIPSIDQNIYARENGWVIQSLLNLFAATDDENKSKQAMVTANWIIVHRELSDGGFRHDDRDHGSYLGDSLAMGNALLQLYANTGDRAWLKKSEQSMHYIRQNFTNTDSKVGGYITSKNIIAGQKLLPDRDENIDMARYANLLFRYTGNESYQKMAKSCMRYLLIPEITNKFFTAGILLADHEVSQDPIHITVVGSKSDPQAQKLFKTALSLPVIYKRIEWKDPKEGSLPNPDVDYPELDRPAAFVCTQKLCSSPIFTLDELKKRMEKIK